ncbi:MAG: septal ring lytic transglycosylase RlpA family protein [Steroidobacteraceae bacterium]|nr:septal ring lytic transglycosylase RlpA family protein [Steroidobacteraceae bacterium]
MIGTLRRTRLPGVLLITVLLAACSVTSRRERPQPPSPTPPVMQPVPPPTAHPPKNLEDIPDAVPRFEPRSKRGNPPSYVVLGKRYKVLDTAEGYVERGVASWYGPNFHGSLTSMGEKYDMYAMTAAHKTLPLPAYARVTNLRNGKSVVVRINDRGPFAKNRLIDLSYVAAAKLDMLREGTTLVEVRALTPNNIDALSRNEETPPQELFVQAGAFAEESNAYRLVQRLKANGIDSAFVQSPLDGKPRLFRVRAGPVASAAEFDRLIARLNKLGVEDAFLALD